MRSQRLPLGRARGGERVRSRRQRPHPRQAFSARSRARFRLSTAAAPREPTG